jgi:predicted nucleotidyltransferase
MVNGLPIYSNFNEMKEISKYNNDIQKLCEIHKVKRLYAFGSILTDKFNANSDVDFIVHFEPFEIAQYADNYYNLKFSLEEILKRPVDLLEEQSIKNPYFLRSIKNQRQLIYGN